MAEISKDALEYLIQQGKASAAPHVIKASDGVERVVHQNGSMTIIKPREHTEIAERPLRIMQAVKVRDAASFLAYHALYSDENTRAFASRDNGCVLAVLDYHKSDDKTARFCGHSVTLALRHTEEWEKWTKNNGKQMEQSEFAEFIEDNAPDVVEPSAAAMYELATTLQATTHVDFKQAVNLQNGEVQLRYEETINGKFGKGETQIPRTFKISIGVYDGQDPILMEARIRFRNKNNKLTFWYQLLYADRWKREAFNAVVKEVAAGGVTVFNGSL